MRPSAYINTPINVLSPEFTEQVIVGDRRIWAIVSKRTETSEEERGASARALNYAILGNTSELGQTARGTKVTLPEGQFLADGIQTLRNGYTRVFLRAST